MSDKINNIIENLKSLTLLEAAELVKQIEEVFDVDASSASNSNMVMMATDNNNLLNNEIEEKTEFDVVLEEVPSAKKIAVLKVVRSLTSLGLKEAKELVESTPKMIKESTSKEDAEEIKAKLEEVGAKVSIK
uniref:50S ribosomal protein L12, chloroplastic n=2 Tax=Membranoptera TaxID=158697 RepID=A0A1L1Y9S5_9FLOR|nr:ribosomal protein L12 [Membranoptera weeksiae]YP_009332848.1 ribosomal protein L12 [Membranoptera tenuis]AHZ94642.1 ribosomal protein L12 [Membranoptera weeksiae]AKL79104.1 ribosomal protein L12 [Membranoptera tenuis]